MAALHTEYLSEDLDDAGNPRSFALRCPPGFNFGYDVVDRLGAQSPERRALRWCNDDGELREYTFGEVSRFSDQAASYFLSMGVRKGDRVLLILKRHPQFWWAIIALHKIGAVAVPATNQLLRYDLVFQVVPEQLVRGGDGDRTDLVQGDDGPPELGVPLQDEQDPVTLAHPHGQEVRRRLVAEPTHLAERVLAQLAVVVAPAQRAALRALGANCLLYTSPSPRD